MNAIITNSSDKSFATIVALIGCTVSFLIPQDASADDFCGRQASRVSHAYARSAPVVNGGFYSQRSSGRRYGSAQSAAASAPAASAPATASPATAPAQIASVQPAAAVAAPQPAPNPPAPAQPATAPTSAFVFVAFRQDISAADMAAFLLAYKVSMVEGPNADGFYTLRLSDPLPSEQVRPVVDSMKSQTRLVNNVVAG
jgi:hypothetical protein